MTSDLNAKLAGQRKDWMVELVLPGLFSLLLAGCLLYLGYWLLQATWLQEPAASYAISAFAN